MRARRRGRRDDRDAAGAVGADKIAGRSRGRRRGRGRVAPPRGRRRRRVARLCGRRVPRLRGRSCLVPRQQARGDVATETARTVARPSAEGRASTGGRSAAGMSPPESSAARAQINRGRSRRCPAGALPRAHPDAVAGRGPAAVAAKGQGHGDVVASFPVGRCAGRSSRGNGRPIGAEDGALAGEGGRPRGRCRRDRRRAAPSRRCCRRASSAIAGRGSAAAEAAGT